MTCHIPACDVTPSASRIGIPDPGLSSVAQPGAGAVSGLRVRLLYRGSEGVLHILYTYLGAGRLNANFNNHDLRKRVFHAISTLGLCTRPITTHPNLHTGACSPGVNGCWFKRFLLEGEIGISGPRPSRKYHLSVMGSGVSLRAWAVGRE